MFLRLRRSGLPLQRVVRDTKKNKDTIVHETYFAFANCEVYEKSTFWELQ